MQALGPGLWSVQPALETRHARDAALAVYPNQATRLDLPPLTPEEQEAIIGMVNDPLQMYVGIGRSVRLLPSNWAMVKQEDGLEVWQAQIHSPAALFLQVRFVNFSLASDMAVKVYNLGDTRSAQVWEYTGRGPEDDGAFWSLSVPGDTVVVEYWRGADNQAKPGTLPFSITSISHTFRDEQGDVVGLDFHHSQVRQAGSCSSTGRQICTSGADSESESTSVLTVSKGIARFYTTLDDGRRSQCSGSLLNNDEKDGALYFLSAWHCVEEQVRDPEVATTEKQITTEFQFLVNRCNTADGYVLGEGSHFVAGSEEGDWTLLRIHGDLRLSGNEVVENGVVGFLGWDAEDRNDFKGFVVHHARGQDQTLATFEGEGLSFLTYPGTFSSCTGPECSHFTVRFDDATPAGGASGSPGFPDGTATVVGVYTHSELMPGCEGEFSRFSQMYRDGRVRGALTYGNDYFSGTGPAKGFDDSQRSVYSRYSCKGGGADLSKAQGSGTAEDPYQLTTLCQLQDMDSSRTAHYQLAAHINDEDSRYLHDGLGFQPVGGGTVLSTVLESDVGKEVQMPGDFAEKISRYAFSGSFDGAGFMIQNLTIDRPGQDFVGLFSIVSTESRLQGINLSGMQITGRDAVGAVAGAVLGGTVSDSQSRELNLIGRKFVGGITGYNHSGNIRNVSILVRIDGSTMVGGVVGYNHSGKIRNVSQISQVGTRRVLGKKQVGGVVGYNGSGSMENIVMEDIRIFHSTTQPSYVGGLVGHNASGTIRFVRLKAFLITGRNYMGGLAGYNESGSIEDVFVLEDKVSRKITGKDYVGGLLGYNESGRIENAFSFGESTIRSFVSGEGDVGGLLGFNESGSIIHSNAVALVQGNNRVGGLVGSHHGGGIHNSFSIGQAELLESTSGNGDSFGGLVGHNAGSISNSFVRRSRVSGSTKTGGLVGSNQGNIHQTYAVSEVYGESEVGGLVGVNDAAATISSSYAIGRALVGRNNGSTPGSALRSLEQLSCTTEPGLPCQGAASYSGWSTQTWDFGDQETLPKIRDFPTSVPTPSPLQLQTQWVFPAALKLSWKSSEAKPHVIGYVVSVEVGDRSLEYLTASTGLTLAGVALQYLRRQAAGGTTVSYSVSERSIFYEHREMSQDTRLLNAPGRPSSISVVPDQATVRVTLAAATNDGYGRAPNNSSYGASVDGISLNLGYRVRISGIGTEQEKTVMQASSKPDIVVEFSGLKSGSAYSAQVVAFNAAGDGMPTEETFSTLVNPAPVISHFFGSDVSGLDSFTVCILPGTAGTTMRAVASDDRPERLRWKIRETPTTMGMINFVGNDNQNISTMTSGTTEVRVRYVPAVDEVSSTAFVIEASDEHGKSDQLAVSVFIVSSPVIAQGASTEVLILGISTKRTIVLNADFPCGGLRWNLVSSTPLSTTAALSESDGGRRVSAELTVPHDQFEASFIIRVTDPESDLSDEIVVRISRQSFFRRGLLRLKAFLGGAVR